MKEGLSEHLIQAQAHSTMEPLEEQPIRMLVGRLPEGWYLSEELLQFLLLLLLLF